MTVQMKRILVIAGLTVLGLIIGFIFFKGLMIVLVAIAGGAIGGIVAAVLIKGAEETFEEVRKTVSTMAAPARRETDLGNVLEQSLALNQRVRLTEGISKEITAAVESIIDIVEELAPSLCTDFRGDELTYHVCRTVTYQVPRLLEPYFKVKPEDRAAVEGGVLKALKAANDDLTEIKTIFRDQGIDAARQRAKTVEMKYSGIGGSAAAA